MAKLTREQRRQVESIIADIQAALDYLMSDRISICRADRINGAVKHCGDEYRQAEPFVTTEYKGRDGSAWSIDWVRTLHPVAKDSGSMLVRLPEAMRAARALLAENEAPPKISEAQSVESIE